MSPVGSLMIGSGSISRQYCPSLLSIYYILEVYSVQMTSSCSATPQMLRVRGEHGVGVGVDIDV
jgi:hypothetical protein